MVQKTDFFWDLPAAFALLTRLPLPRLPDHAFAGAARAVWAYPLVGGVLGAVAAGLGAVLSVLGLPALMCGGVMLAALVLLTGAMHEDGLADTADGLWGGMDRARRLEIMKDSRIGTYGVMALILATGLRWLGFAEVSGAQLVCACVLSRAMMPPLMAALPHARTDGLSKSVGQPALAPMLGALGLGGVVALALAGTSGLLAMGLAGAAAFGLAALARAKIGGQTGDILGATQVICEITVLMTFVALAA